ncbi:hypothetical protein ACFQ2K_43800 [Streptomyces sanglieri]|uniref:Uncharacterized protein n=1 Tax=Streptomyces sanglieri TaxID=193460 RepID=A0ABW2X9K1_9ACTN
MTQPSQEARVTHRFAVELTDYLEACPGARLMTGTRPGKSSMACCTRATSTMRSP